MHVFGHTYWKQLHAFAYMTCFEIASDFQSPAHSPLEMAAPAPAMKAMKAITAKKQDICLFKSGVLTRRSARQNPKVFFLRADRRAQIHREYVVLTKFGLCAFNEEINHELVQGLVDKFDLFELIMNG